MLYEDRLYGFAVAAMQLAPWHPSRQDGAEEAMAIAVAMEAAFSATLKTRRDAAEQAAKKAREDAARAAVRCIHCGHSATLHAVDDEERGGCLESCCPCVQYECTAVQS